MLKREIMTANILHSSQSNEWYTPSKYVEAARSVMGSIDLDPASCKEANKIVKALAYYTEEQDGLRLTWWGNVFCNPPYGKTGSKSNQELFAKKALESSRSGVSQIILLVNATTDRKWFQELWNYPICFTNHRIKFYTPGEDKTQPTHGSAFIYFGKNIDRFTEVFSEFGKVIRPNN